MIGLFIGRFQPLHLGHYSAMKYSLKNVDSLIVGVGSAQYADTVTNPFSFSEREKMIEYAFEDVSNKEKLKIVAIPDLHNECIWVEHVLSCTGPVDLFFGNDPYVKTLFEKKKVAVHDVPFYDRSIYNATRIRENITKGLEWKSFLPKKVADYIIEIDGLKRIKEIENERDYNF